MSKLKHDQMSSHCEADKVIYKIRPLILFFGGHL